MTTFESISLIINGALLLATAGATVVAWGMAASAGREKRDAETARDEAVAAQEKAAAALVEANAIAQEALEAQRLALPPLWGTPEEVKGDTFSIMNNSGRTVVVTGLDSLPGGNVYVFLPPALPARVEHGDSLRFTAIRGGAKSTAGNSVKLEWAYEDQPEVRISTERRF